MYVLGYWHDPVCLVARYPNPGKWETSGFPWCTCPDRHARNTQLQHEQVCEQSSPLTLRGDGGRVAPMR